MDSTKVKLENGSSLVLINLPGIKSVTVSAFIRAGFKYDPPGKPGLAHFTEHMLFDGTKKYPSPKQLSWTIERYGGWHYAFTWVEHQIHTLHLPKDYLDIGIEVLLDMLVNPLIDEKEIEREKGMVKEEILRNRSDSEKAVLDYAWQPLFFKGTSLARPYSGEEQDIDRITKNDVNKFIETHFLANSTVFLVAGDFDQLKVKELFEFNTKDYSRKERQQNIGTVSNSKERVKVYPYTTEQASIVIGIKGVPFKNKDKYKLELVKDLLAGYYGSRLPQRLREEGGLIYKWNTWQDNFSDTGYLIFRSSIALQNTDQFIKIVLEEFGKLTKIPISEEELAIAKGHIAGDLFCNIQTGLDFTNWYGLQELLGEEMLSLEGQAGIYKKISSEELLDTAKKYFRKENIYIAIAGDIDSKKITFETLSS